MREKKRNQLEQIYKTHAKSLYYFLWRMSGSAHVAEDLTQETFVRATISLPDYKDEEAKAWLFKVARNVYLDEWRKKQRRKAIPLFHFLTNEEMISPYGRPEEDVLKQETTHDVQELMQCLPEQYRMILYLKEYEQFSYLEIQQALDLSETQVKVTLHRARKRLAQLSEKKGWRLEYDGME